MKQSLGRNAEATGVSQPSDATYTFGAFRLVPRERKLLLDGQVIHLGSRAFAILVALVERAGTVVGTDELMRVAWPGLTVEEANVRVQVGYCAKHWREVRQVAAPSRQYRLKAIVSSFR